MLRRAAPMLLVVAALSPFPLVGQDRSPSPLPSPPAAPAAPPAPLPGPRLWSEFPSYRPELARDSAAVAEAIVADRTTITISTLGLVLLVVLVVLLLA